MDKEFLDKLAADNAPFGEMLATQVANKLANGESIGHFHRDYCGMGMQKDGEGNYVYGELLDGYINTIFSKFAGQDAFIRWLSQQSTASLARLNDADEFFRGNQVITRERLMAFVQVF